LDCARFRLDPLSRESERSNNNIKKSKSKCKSKSENKSKIKNNHNQQKTRTGTRTKAIPIMSGMVLKYALYKNGLIYYRSLVKYVLY
jgi:hypothetical protein